KDLTATNAMRIVTREVLVGGLNGVLFALLMGAIGGVWFSSVTIGAVLAVAMVINLLFAGLAGILVPLGLDRAGVDPAVASTVLVTTVTDIVGFFVFLGLATVVFT
ncbi:MAG: magnesium transporter, partial [Alphaproteobacteria bacterium]